MKKLLAMAAMIAVVIFTGCSKDNDGSGVSGGTAYSGDLLGTWTYTDSYGDIERLTFYSDGSFVEYCTEIEDNYNYEEKGLFYISGNIIAFQYLFATDSDGNSFDYAAEDELYYEYAYIVDNTSDYLEISWFEGSDDLDWEWANEALEKYHGGEITSGDKYNKE